MTYRHIRIDPEPPAPEPSYIDLALGIVLGIIVGLALYGPIIGR